MCKAFIYLLFLSCLRVQTELKMFFTFIQQEQQILMHFILFYFIFFEREREREKEKERERERKSSRLTTNHA